MKQILTLLLLLCSMTAAAQDIVVKKDGTAIQAIVTEVLSNDVKYKKFSNPDGPTYTVAIADLLSITYKNGEVEKFNTSSQATEEPIQSIAKQQQVSDEELLRMATVEENSITNPQQSVSDAELLRMATPEKPQKTQLQIAVKQSQRFKRMANTMSVIGYPISLGMVILGACLMDEPGIGCGIMGGGAAFGLLTWYTASCYRKMSNRIVQNISFYQHDFNFSNGTRLSASSDLIRDNYTNQTAIGFGFHYNF